MSTMSDSLIVAQYNDAIIFEIPYLDPMLVPGETNLESIRLPSSGIGAVKHLYFAYKVNGNWGYYYDESSETLSRKTPIDSFLNTTVFKNISFIDKKNDSLVLSTDYGKDSAIEKYIVKVKPNSSYSDSTILYYSNKMSQINYSLSRELDEKKRMKLVKVVAVNNPKYDSASGVLLPKTEMIFAIKLASLNNPQLGFQIIKKLNDLQ